MSILFKRFVIAFTILISALFVTSCDKTDDPVSTQEEHFEAIGMVFRTSGIEAARILRGITTDTLKGPEGAIGDALDITFINEDENEIAPPSEPKLAWEIDDPTIFEVWQHPGEEGGYEFHVKGLKEGETKIEFFIMHEGHSDFRSGKIPVKIEHEEGSYGEPVGLIIFDEESGNQLVKINQDGSVNGNFALQNGTTTDHLVVKFFDENGTQFQPPVPDHGIQLSISNTNVAVITGQDAAEPYAFKIEAKSVGTAQLEISLLHDESIEKTFANIQINVN
ncbi:MAG: hypothetical protein K8F60_12570 [Melioribacteraceae bacterium]|nr:hypothetical protein [Melioribacteraceae bacterium]